MKYQVVEKFVSVNGEGRRAGELAVFIRFAGCNLHCSYCDTLWANEPNVSYEEMSAAELGTYIQETGMKNVTLTGGEPLLQPEISHLLTYLTADPQLKIEIETNGSVAIQGLAQAFPSERVAFTMDYKLGASGMEYAMNVKNFQYLRKNDTVKLVVGSVNDLKRAKAIIEEYGLRSVCSLHLSPVFGKITLENIVMFMKDHQMKDVRLQPQLHKYIWHPDTRGV